MLGCVSKNRDGKELAEIGQLVAAGAVGFTDDGAPVYDPELMRRAFEYCLMFDKPVLNHAEIRELAQHGVMHEGLVSLILGLPGIPAASEDVMVSRDIALAEATGGRLHVMHVSTSGSVDILRRAKLRGVRVTAEATPHHFTLTDESLRAFDSNFKMNPPLRSQDHVQAIIAGLADGAIDVIASDHAPHAKEKKMQGAGPGPVRNCRPGDFAGPGRHKTDRTRPPGLAYGPGKDDHESRADPGPPERHFGDWRGCRYYGHRPPDPLDRGLRTVPNPRARTAHFPAGS